MQFEHNPQPTQRTFVFIVEECTDKGLYPFERLATLATLLKDENIFLFTKTTSSTSLAILQEAQLSPILFEQFEQLSKHLKKLQPDIVIIDGKDSEQEQIELIKPFCKSLIHFDDYGNGNTKADYVLLSLYPEQKDMLSPNMISGSFLFSVPHDWPTLQASSLKTPSNPPHIVVAFENGDANNLTYRTLRHLTQLHIPLQITVIIDELYRHAIDDLQLMILSRRHTNIVKKPDALKELLPLADIVICNASYTPYKIAAYAIPCITFAQNERELLYAFPREQNGFIHLGLGRKMKQSHIQNAVMELLLHEARRERAVQRQRKLLLHNNNEILRNLLLDIAEDPHKITSTNYFNNAKYDTIV